MTEQENMVEEAEKTEAPVNIDTEDDALVSVETITEEAADYPAPRGAFLWVMLMMVFYIFYWTLSYFEIFVIRGS